MTDVKSGNQSVVAIVAHKIRPGWGKKTETNSKLGHIDTVSASFRRVNADTLFCLEGISQNLFKCILEDKQTAS